MRVVFLTPMPHLVTLGGANRSIRLTAEKLASLGHEVMVCGSLLGEGPGRLTRAEVDGRAVVTERRGGSEVREPIEGVAYLGVSPLEESLHILAAALSDFGPDVLLVAGEDTNGCLHRLALNHDASRTVVFAQTPDLLPLQPAGDALSAQRRELLEAAAGLVVTSRYAERIAASAGLTHARCVFPPVFDVPAHPVNAGTGGPVLLGNPSTIKGIDTLISLAEARQTRAFVGVPLWATTADDIARMKAFRNITVRDPDEDFSRVLRNVGVLIVPSIWNENFPLTLTSALAHGVPAVTSDVGGLPEAGLGIARIAPAIRPDDPPRRREDALRIWLAHLDELADRVRWQDESDRSRAAAAAFARLATAERFLAGLCSALDLASRTTSGAAE